MAKVATAQRAIPRSKIFKKRIRNTSSKLNRIVFNLAFGKRTQKNSPIRFRFNPRVKHYDDPGISFASNQSLETLLEFNDRFWKLVITEWISACRSNCFQSRLQQRLVGNTERQFGNDHVLQRVALNVDALPETIGAEQNTTRVAFKLIQKLCPRNTAALNIESVLFIGQPRRKIANGSIRNS